MVSAFDRIVMAVPSLAEASDQYSKLLGLEPVAVAGGEPARLWFELANVVIELVQSNVELPLVRGIVFSAAEAGQVDTAVSNSLGLDLRVCNGELTRVHRAQNKRPQAELCVDHIVLRTVNAADCIDLFSERLGIRLALDKTVPEWGGRMLFFRTGKVTLEVIESHKDKPETDTFWGIAYQCQDLEQMASRLSGLGVILSGIRPGRKPGSRVATVKSHCLGIPTLLLQQP